MSNTLTRRDFVKVGAALAAAAAVGLSQRAHAGQFTGKIKKAIKYNMVNIEGPVAERFRIVKELGFDGIEVGVGDKLDKDEALAAVKSTGLPIHGVVGGSLNDIGGAVDLAAFYGATSVLVVAGRVTAENSYAKNYADTQKAIREAIPHAKERNILLLVENVWNDFLTSPIEYARYIDELESDMVGAYFDAGNVARYGWPEHWIPVLGSRIKKIDVKDFSRSLMMKEGPWKGFEVELGDGEIDFAAVRRELGAIGYTGFVTSEVKGGDRDRLADIAKRMDRIFDL